MKIKYIKPAILIFIVFVFSCKKTPEIPSGNKIEIGETTIDSIAYYTANVSTIITSTGVNEITQHGHCWSIDKEPTIEDEKTTLGKLSLPITIFSELTGLDANTTYNIRSYITYKNGTLYGEENVVTTIETRKPIVTTNEVINITINTATCGGTNDDGGFTISHRGVCWNTIGNPTFENSLGHTNNGQGTGSFISNITGLTDNETYYVTAYALNEKGTGYGVELQFTTVPLTIPTVTTLEITNITTTSANSGGNVTSNGNSTVSARGVCWNDTGNPTLENNIGYTTDDTGLGSFNSQLEGLTEYLTYFVAAYATNEEGTSYGQVISFMATIDFIDPRDGQAYDTVTIGTQTWFAKNLNYQTIDSWWYDNSIDNGDIYGRLYTWDAALNACPNGWHLPCDDEWTILATYLEGATIAGGKMKETGTTHWDSPNTGATNSSGFTALPGGTRGSSSNDWFQDLGSSSYWWSSNESSSTNAICWDLYHEYVRLGHMYYYKNKCFSVRCLKD